ncbi:hypothetical protein A0J51_02981 [Gluconobacter japonicus]|nr:hypothetical protein A0J51_02981 [Gluconobacter japonicus]
MRAIHRIPATEPVPGIHLMLGSTSPFGRIAKQIDQTVLVRGAFKTVVTPPATGSTGLAGVCLMPSHDCREVVYPSIAFQSRPRANEVPLKPDTAAVLIDKMANLSGLTRDEIGGLFGVSRRSVQNWVAGGNISAGHERHLRSIMDVLREYHPAPGVSFRDSLLHKPAHSVSAADLLTARNYAGARARLTGDLSGLSNSNRLPPAEPLDVQFSRIEGKLPGTDGTLNRRISRPIVRRS